MVKPVYNLPASDSGDVAAAEHWLASLPSNYPSDALARIREACAMLVRCRGNQTLETGETQVRHLLCTADILVGLRMDADTLVAALLNGCLGKADITEQQLSERFGPGIAGMVGDLHRIGQIADVDAVIAAKDQDEHEENLRRLLLGIAEDVRVVLVVLAERLHLMRAIKDLEDGRRRKLGRDTQRVYAPLANRLGVWQIKWELEDLSLRYLDPDEYTRVAKLLGDRRAEREAYIASVISLLNEKFAEAGIRADISGRPKHIYSIWKKMQRKGVDIEQIFDLRAVRVMVGSVADCYASLGIVHGLWKHIPNEFDDYIATPKGNMYQSLHTAVVGPQDKPLEVQIRTWDMHRHAEFGVAAHWAYKESKGHDAEFQRRVIWMRNWLELKNEGEEAGDFVERFKTEFEPSHVYVLTPQSKVIELPRGATALDFAYAIHSEVGNRCRGARIDGRIVPLNQVLRSGQTVEIITQKSATPSRDWLSPHHGYLKTAKARNRVRQWFKQQDYDRYVSEGRALLEKEMTRLGIEGKPNLEQIGLKFNFHKGEDLLAGIGRGEIPVGQIARQVGEPKAEIKEEPQDHAAEAAALVEKRRERRRKQHPRRDGAHSEVVIEGIDDLMTHMAHCCKPVPYDPIVGYITRGRGVTVHRRDCSNLRNLSEPEQARLIDVNWSDQVEDAAYPVDIMVLASDRKGLLRDISSVLSDDDVDVVGVNTVSDRRTDRASMRFTVEVKNMDQLEQVIVKLRQIPDVIGVRRPH
jgi:GTP pyrophosphokinase